LNLPALFHGRTIAARGKRRWRLRESPLRGRLEGSGLPDLTARLLENRGIGTRSEASAVLGGREAPSPDPSAIPGFPAAVGRLRQAARAGEAVTVFGDFDVDGVTSTAIIVQTLNDLGARARPYLPHRAREGYGLNRPAIESIAAAGATLLVTCDCGTSSRDEVGLARSRGLDVLVVDHHAPPAELPPATAVVNPKLAGAAAEVTPYATAGLAFVLAQATYDACRRPFPEAHYLEAACLGTVADLVPLLDENRSLVRRGLAALARTQRPGLAALMEAARIKPADVTSEAIAFALAPRLNAAGRLADARLAYELLTTADEARAASLAEQLDALNRERQRLTREAEELARDLLPADGAAPITVVGHPAFHQGVVGLVASRLVETLGRPAVVYQKGAQESRGSCRSIREYDIVSALRSCGDLFERYGGHHQAGGFTIRNERLTDLGRRLEEHAAANLADVELGPWVDIDAEWPLEALRSQEIRWMGRLQPFGMENPQPVLLSRSVVAVESRGVGEDGRHLRLKIRAGPISWSAIAFDWEAPPPAEGERFDLVYALSSDRYGPSFDGSGGALQLTVLDMAPAG
jgi:single-stranded-DNA-specific exonuclease